MTTERLTALMAERVMRWRVGPDRFLTGGRGWLPRWRFRPVIRMADATRLLEQAAPEEYATGTADSGGSWARVRIAGVARRKTPANRAKHRGHLRLAMHARSE